MITVSLDSFVHFLNFFELKVEQILGPPIYDVSSPLPKVSNAWTFKFLFPLYTHTHVWCLSNEVELMPTNLPVMWIPLPRVIWCMRCVCVSRLVDCLKDLGPGDWQLAGQVCQALWNMIGSGGGGGSEKLMDTREKESLLEILITYLGRCTVLLVTLT